MGSEKRGDLNIADTGSVMIYVFAPKDRYIHFDAHQSICGELLMAQAHGIQITCSGAAEFQEDWKRKSAALTHFLLGRTESVCVFIDARHSWFAGELMLNAQIADREGVPVSAIYPIPRFGGTFPILPESEPTEEDLVVNYPIGTHDARLFDASRIDTGFLAIPRRAVEALMDKLSLDREPWEQMEDTLRHYSKLERLMWYQMVLTESNLANQNRFIDFFRPFTYVTSQNELQHLGASWSFAERCKMAGIRCKLNVRPEVTTIGSHGFSWKDAFSSIDDMRGKFDTKEDSGNTDKE